MPNPVQDLTTQAVMRAAETTPDDAAYALERRINPALMSAETKSVDEAEQQKRLYGMLASTVEGNAWLRSAGNAALANQNLQQLAAIRADVEAMQLPDPEGAGAQFGAILSQSFRRGRMGAQAVLATPLAGAQALGQAVTGGDPWDNALTTLSDVANAHESDEARRLEDIEYARRRLGGSKIAHIAASVLGQAPEMLVTGFGAATAVKGVASQGLRSFLVEYAAAGTRAALTPAQLKKAVAGTAFVQGSYEGGRTLVDRMQNNAADGKDLLTSSDVAAAMATAAVVMLTEGFSTGGEMSVLTAGSQRTRSEIYRNAMRDVVVQPGQEVVQEVTQQIISDLADGKYVNWDEAGWAGLAGAIGGTMFAAPSLVQAFAAGRSAPDQAKTQAAAPLLRTAAQSPQIVHNVATIEQVRASVAAMPGVANLPAAKMAEMVAAAAPSLKQQHIDVPQFTAIAESKGMTVEELAQAWNATVDAGQVSLKTTDLAVALSQEKPDVVAAVYDAVRSEPDAPSLKEMQDAIPEIQKLAQGDVKEMLPDGTVDDTEPVTKEIEQSILAASNKRITPTMAKATAELWTQAYRGAAIRWNNAAAKAGKSERKTTANIWSDIKPTFAQGEVVGMSQPDPKAALEAYRKRLESLTDEQRASAAVKEVVADAENDPVGALGNLEQALMVGQKPKKLSQPGDRASYDPFKKIIGLGDKADVSSVNHELMHHWLDVTQQYAQSDGAPVEFREDLDAIGAWATKTASKVVEHAAKSGIIVTEDQVIATAKDMVSMRILSPGGRAIHEAVTGAFEQYLSSGKAPSKNLQAVFARMKRWFTSIYRTMVHANATGTDLLTPEIEAVFKRILRSQDQAEAGSFRSLSPEVLKVSGGVYDELYKAHAQEIDEAQAKLDEKLQKQADALTEQDKKALIAEQREALAIQPVFKAQILLATNKLDAALVSKLLAGTGSETLDLTSWQAAVGQDPVRVAEEAGYESPQRMLEELAKSPTLEAEATSRAEEIWAGNGYLTPTERVDQMRQSNQYRLKLAAVERAIINAALRSTNVATEEATAQAERMTSDAVAAEREKWKARVDQIAEQAKIPKKAWDTESAILLNEMRQDYGAAIRDGAAYRMETSPKSAAAIAKEIAEKSAKLAKAVSHGDWRAALLAHWDIATLAEMQRIVSDGAQTQAQSAKKLTAEALRKQATMDAALMAELAANKAAKMPVSEMKLGQWEKRADAARGRRERYVAEQNIAGILRSTNEIAWAEAMASEVNRILSLQSALVSAIRKQTSPEGMKILQTHGLPAVIDNQGITHVFSTEREQEIFFANNGSAANGYVKTRSDDLTSVANGIRTLMSPTKLEDAQAAFQLMIDRKLSGFNLLSNEFINLMRLKADPKQWTETDWLIATAQLESVHQTAQLRPAFSDRIDSAAQELIGMLDGKLSNRTPATQETDMSTARYLLETSITSQANLRTTVSDLGDVGKRLFVDMSAMAEENQRGMSEKIKKQLDAAYQQFSIADRQRLDAVTVVDGVQGDGWARMGRLLMWGTETGRQRVREDLRLYGATDADGYMKKQMRGLTQPEINFLNAMWSANEDIWAFTQGAAREVGKPIPRTLKASSFTVTDDMGQTVMLSGGYASVPYKDHFPEAHLIDPNTGQMARMDDSSLFERADAVKGRHLDLTLDAQYQRMLSRIRLGSYMQPANFLSSLLANKDLRFKLEEKFGADWVRRLIGHFSFTFNGLPREGMGAGFLMGNMQSAVYAFNPLTAIKQPLGIINAAPHPNIGMTAMLTSIRQFLTDPVGLHHRVAEMSFRYRDRLDNANIDIQAPTDSIGRANNLTAYRRATTWMMRRAQMTADLMTWNAAYQRQYMDRVSAGMSPEEAKYEARKVADDTLFETQGSAWRTESAVINQTRMGQIMTFSGKWMINYSNYLYRLFRTAKTDGSWESWLKFSNSVFTGLVMSSVAMAAANAILRPRDDELPDPSASDYARKIALDVVGTPVWWARAALPPLYGAVTGEPSSMTTLFPADMFLRDAKTVATQVNNIFDEDQVQVSKLIGGLIGTGSMVIPNIPAVQAKRILDAAASDADAGHEAWAAAVFGWDRSPASKRQ